MKLIIDIQQTAYDAIQALKDVEGTNEGTLENVLIKAVENGTPLDKIRTEIEKISIAPFATAYTAKKEALEIIDRYREGEQA